MRVCGSARDGDGNAVTRVFAHEQFAALCGKQRARLANAVDAEMRAHVR